MDFQEHWWQTRKFATLTGVTVRTLHHYDRIGLLKPSRRDANGFRLYGLPDFARLQHINTLKFIGFSLRQIKEVLASRAVSLDEALALQRAIIEDQHKRLGLALEAIRRAQQVLAKEGKLDIDAFAEISEVMNMEHNFEWTKKYYSDEAKAKIEQRKDLWSPELQERVMRDWAELVADIEKAMAGSVRPSDAAAKPLAERWRGLVGEFTGGDREIYNGLEELYANEGDWQTEWKKPFSDEVQAWAAEAIKADRSSDR